MPNNDLGTAHGKIKVTYDDKGSVAATAALIKMQKQFEQMNKSLIKIEKSLTDADSGMESLERGIRKTEKAAKGMSTGFFDAHKSISRFSKDTRDLVQDLRSLYNTAQKAKTKIDGVTTAIKLFNTAGQYSRGDHRVFRGLIMSIAELKAKNEGLVKSWRDAQQSMINFTRDGLKFNKIHQNSLIGTRSAISLIGAGYLSIRNKIFGVNKALSSAPQWVSNMQKVALSIVSVGSALGVVAFALKPFKYLEKFGNSKLFHLAVKGSEKFAEGLAAAGGVIEKVFGRNIFTGFINKLGNAEKGMTRFLFNTSVGAGKLQTGVDRLSKKFFQLGKDSKSLVGGIALVSSSIGNLWHRFQWFFKLPKPIMAGLAIMISRVLPTALHGLGVVLRGTSNLLVGLWDGIKQISKGFVILPGLISTVTVGITSLIPVFKGLKDQFKNVFSDDPAEAMEAWAKLPEHLKPMAKALLDIKPKFKELQVVLQKIAFDGIEKQIKSLAENYFPVFQNGAGKVITAIRAMKDEFVGFLLNEQTKGDTNSIYTNTANAIMGIAKATIPASKGLRDMSVVGTEFIASMSAFAPVLARQFSAWAEGNRASGMMQKWMQDSVHGVYNLIKGTKDLAGSVWEVLTLFKSNQGGDWLQRFADYAEKLNEKAKNSAVSGWLADIRNAVRNMGENKMNEVTKVFKIFGELIKQTTPFITTLSESFSSKFVPAMQASLFVVREFLEFVNEIGASKLIGWILGVFGAATLLPKVFATSIDAIKGVVGSILILANKGKVISGITDMYTALAAKLDGMGGKFATVGNGMMNIHGPASKVIGVLSSLVSAFTVVALAAAAFYAIYSSGKANSEAFDAQIETNKKQLISFKEALKQAFTDDGTFSGKNVLTAVKDNMKDVMTNLEATAEKMPGFGDSLYDYFFRIDQRVSGISSGVPVLRELIALFGQSEKINSEQEIANQAQLAAAGFAKLRDAGIDVNKILMSTDATFNNFIETSRKGGHEANAVADAMQKQRDVMKSLERDFKQAGPAAITLSEGIAQIAQAGGDATEKMDGLKKIMEAMGFLETSSLDAVNNYQKGLRELVGEIEEIGNKAQGLKSNLITTEGAFNLTTEAGSDLYEQLKQLGTEYRAAAVTEGADKAYADFRVSLDKLAQGIPLTVQELENLATKVGIVKDLAGVPIEFAIQAAEANDDVVNGMLTAFLGMKKAIEENNTVQPVVVPKLGDAQHVADEINKILPGYASVEGTNLVIKPGFDQTQADNVRRAIENLTEPVTVDIIPNVLPPNKPIAPAPDDINRSATPGGSSPNPKSSPGPSVMPGGGALPTGGGGRAFNDWEAINRYLDESVEDTSDDAKDGGKSFTKSFADGIKANQSKVEKAADDIARAAKDRMPGSPAKKGPLAGSGWSMYAGKSFTSDFASGIESNAGRVASAANTVAGAAGAGIQNDKTFQAGKFLGQISSIIDVLQNTAEVFTKIADTAFKFAKFASDPLGKGTFFGKRLGFKRDPNISDEMLAQRRADEAQSRWFSFRNSGQYPDNYNRQTGGVGQLTPGANQQQIANYIIDKALSLGYSKSQADQFLIQAVGESGLSPDASNPNGWNGIFQFDKPTWEGAGGGNVFDPQKNIDNYFNLAAQRLLTPQNFTNPSQLGTQVSIGGPQHPENAAKGALANAQAQAQQYLKGYTPNAGQITSGLTPGLPQSIAGIVGSSGILRDQGPVPSSPASRLTAEIIARQFPEIKDILGSDYGHVPGTHDVGKSIDISIPNWDTPAGKALGDRINAYLQANATALGIDATIWQNKWKRASDGYVSPNDQPGHFDHIDVNFPTGLPGINPDGTINLSVPYGSPGASAAYGPPPTPEDPGVVAPRDLVRILDNGLMEAVHGTGDQPGPDIPINKATGKPWTPEESLAYWSRPENRKQYDRSLLQPGDENVPGLFKGSQEELIQQLESQNPLLKGILSNTNGMPEMSEQQAIETATAIQGQIDSLSAIGTPESRAQISVLNSALSDVTSNAGLTESDNPIDTAASVASAASSIAADVFNVINSTIDSFGATKEIADTLVRGIQNTEDIYNIVDQVQTYFQLIADIAGATADVTSLVGGIVGAAAAGDPSGGTSGAAMAISAIGQIAGMVQAAWETVNAVIDIGQEVYRIAGSYFGQYLGMLTGGPEGALMGNVKFLLDEQSKQLLNYSADNPGDKRIHDFAFQTGDSSGRNQLIGTVNVYGGPGSDPRDNTRQMMYQVRASTMGQATGQ